MKKGLIFSLLLAVVFGFSSCSDDDDDDAPFLGAKVNVTVKNLLGNLQKGETVYLYKDSEPTQSTTPGDAKKQVVTNENGVAEFSLNLTELNILESQTTLYFAVFYKVGDETLLKGSEGVTVKRGDAKNVTIDIPL